MRQRSIALSIMTCCVDHFITAAGITSGDALILGCRAIDTPFKYRSISQTQAQAQRQGHRSAPAAIHPGDPLGSFRPPFFRFIIGFSFWGLKRFSLKTHKKLFVSHLFLLRLFFRFLFLPFDYWLITSQLLCVSITSFLGTFTVISRGFFPSSPNRKSSPLGMSIQNPKEKEQKTQETQKMSISPSFLVLFFSPLICFWFFFCLFFLFNVYLFIYFIYNWLFILKAMLWFDFVILPPEWRRGKHVREIVVRTALKLLWKCSETARETSHKLPGQLRLRIGWKPSGTCPETAPKPLRNCPETALDRLALMK